MITCASPLPPSWKGLISDEEVQLTIFADDLTCFLKDKQSYLHILTFSGLRVNNDKTELFAIGSQKLVRKEFPYKVCISILITIKQQRRNLNALNWKGGDKIK